MIVELRNKVLARKIRYRLLRENHPANGWYKVLDPGRTKIVKGTKICLSTNSSENPFHHKGGIYGDGFDVVRKID